jgi:hypothetical protein
MFDDSRCKTLRFADFPVRSVGFELKREKFEGALVKLVILRLPRRIPQEREKAGGEV